MSQVLVFPGPAFAWTFYVVLVALMAVAAYFDLRRMVIPKAISLSALALGVIFNIVRGGWLGGLGRQVWLFEPSGVALGMLDGLLYALAGFGLGFALFFVMWFLGTAGGGDVKLFAALGAWLGPVLAIYVLIGSMVFVILFSAGRMVKSAFSGKIGQIGGKPKQKNRVLTYSLPIALSTALILLWVCRYELQIAPPRTSPGNGTGAAAQETPIQAA